MSSRDAILGRITANKPAFMPLPASIDVKPASSEVCLDQFIKSFKNAGGVVQPVSDLASIGHYLREKYSPTTRFINTVEGVGFGIEVSESETDGHMFANLEIAIIAGSLGVAENGAIWVSEHSLPLRVLPFICEHLMLVIHHRNLVSNMHEAYAHLDVAASGYGVFIAGPSRTADIEQSLVIGAHGPKRAHVFIVQD